MKAQLPKSALLEIALQQNHTNMRFMRAMGLCFKKAHVTHPELEAILCLPRLGVKTNPSSPLYTMLDVITKARLIEVNVSWVL